MRSSSLLSRNDPLLGAKVPLLHRGGRGGGYIIMLLLLLLSASLWAQTALTETLPDSLLRPILTQLPCPDATALSVDEQGSLYLACPEANCLYKLSGAKLDSILRIGGKGVGGESLNDPTDVLASNRLEVWVLDVDTRRLLLLNPNLKVLRYVDFMNLDQQFPGRQLPEQLNPTAFTLSAASELFVLNQDDNIVYKFDAFFRYETHFGGTAYGQGSLQTPNRLLAGPANSLYVLDTAAQTVQVFGNQGLYKHQLPLSLPFRWQTGVIYQNDLFLGSSVGETSHLVRYSLVSGQQRILRLPQGHRLRDLWASYRGLYLLTQNGVFLYAH